MNEPLPAHCMKSVQQIYSVNIRIQSEHGKIRIRKNSVLGHFSHRRRLQIKTIETN